MLASRSVCFLEEPWESGSSVCVIHKDRDYHIGSNFWKFYLIRRIGFTLRESVSLVKVFRLVRLKWIFFGVHSVDTGGRCTTSYLYWQGHCVCDALF